ncbi:hypothetical protein AB0I81_49195 [Nonomuraea sp. NPDC050404]|uniref:hypothetical protein n=1 Tax=Nonomuraea sp. NPDC050404 TaxID=3155783 RepID=UPI0033E7ABF2
MSKIAITWKLSTDAKGLPTRPVSTIPATAIYPARDKDTILRFDTRYSAWGTKVSIKPPASR